MRRNLPTAHVLCIQAHLSASHASPIAFRLINDLLRLSNACIHPPETITRALLSNAHADLTLAALVDIIWINVFRTSMGRTFRIDGTASVNFHATEEDWCGAEWLNGERFSDLILV